MKRNYTKEESLTWKQSLKGVTADELTDWAMEQPFPGSNAWEAKHPIWDSFLPGMKSPRDAWKDRKLVKCAVQNMFWIINKDLSGERRYLDFDKDHLKHIKLRDLGLAQKILARFTIAKIAPKVTALSPAAMLRIIDQSGIDISNGCYCPMAGFGGIIEACRRWGKKQKVDLEIEAYDINKKFCKWYGWTQRDMLAQVIKTDKTCIVCPPFGYYYEHWKGTPDEMSDITFLEWYGLIKKHVKAPNYIIIGPEIRNEKTSSNKGLDSKGNKRNGLFTKTTGIMLWTDKMYKLYKSDSDARKKAGIKE